MTKKIAFLYAGQGSQRIGMGKDLYEEFETYRQVMEQLDAAYHMKELMHDAELSELSKTENTQCCMAAFAAGVTAVLKEKEIVPAVTGGLSLGEYGALHVAGVFDAKTYVGITKYRGKVMSEAAEGTSCCMSAVLGVDSTVVEEACAECASYGYIIPANYNCPGQYVICGEEAAVLKAEEVLKAKGAKRCIRLNVSGPFHTKFMEPAAEKLAAYLEKIDFGKPQIPVLLNLTGDYYDGVSDLKENLKMQVKSSVRFEGMLQKMLENGITTFLEIGPGKALSGFVRKTAQALGKEVEIYVVDTAEDLKKVIAALSA